jgi:uncharacterized protein YjiS (DUF1127 family)
MRQNCIDTIETTTAPLPSWGQWINAGARKVKADMLQLVSLYATWNERARQRRHMQNLSDEILKDVGLSREDINQQVSKAFWQD